MSVFIKELGIVLEI